MINLNLYQQGVEKEEHIDVFYHTMQPVVQKVIDLVNGEQKILWGKTEDEKVSIQLDDIFYIESVEKKSFAYLSQEVYEVEGTLAELEERLNSYGFVRISKSHIVNVYCIKSIKPEMNMRVCATFENGEKIYINRSYKKSFYEYLVRMRGNVDEK